MWTHPLAHRALLFECGPLPEAAAGSLPGGDPYIDPRVDEVAVRVIGATLLASHQGLDPTAARVATHNEMLDVQNANRVLERSRGAMDGFPIWLRIWRNQIRYVPDHEDITLIDLREREREERAWGDSEVKTTPP